MEATNQTTPRCTVAADLALLLRYQNGDEEALAELVGVHIGLIDFWARRIAAKVPSANLDDIKQEGIVGFIKAAKRFDCSKAGAFHSYAKKYVVGEIYQSPEVSRIGRSQYRQYRRVKQAYDGLMLELDRRPTLDEVSKQTGLAVGEVEHFLTMPLFPDSLAEDDDCQAPEDPLTALPLLYDAIRQLNPTETQIIIRFYLFGKKDREIAAELGRSVGAIKTARLRAEEKLRILMLDGGQKHGTSRY
jgi:RNA polymerase sporulation-specific sigma factor